MTTHPPYKAHPVLGLLCWCEAEGQYRRVNPNGGYPSNDEFAEIQREADRLNAGINYRPMTEEEEAAFEEWLTRVLPLQQIKHHEKRSKKAINH